MTHAQKITLRDAIEENAYGCTGHAAERESLLLRLLAVREWIYPPFRPSYGRGGTIAPDILAENILREEARHARSNNPWSQMSRD
jgi:hypothetical protein